MTTPSTPADVSSPLDVATLLARLPAEARAAVEPEIVAYESSVASLRTAAFLALARLVGLADTLPALPARTIAQAPTQQPPAPAPTTTTAERIREAARAAEMFVDDPGPASSPAPGRRRASPKTTRAAVPPGKLLIGMIELKAYDAVASRPEGAAYKDIVRAIYPRLETGRTPAARTTFGRVTRALRALVAAKLVVRPTADTPTAAYQLAVPAPRLGWADLTSLVGIYVKLRSAGRVMTQTELLGWYLPAYAQNARAGSSRWDAANARVNQALRSELKGLVRFDKAAGGWIAFVGEKTVRHVPAVTGPGVEAHPVAG